VPQRPEGIALVKLMTMPATVPGNVELALQAAGLAPDPLIAPNTWDYVRFETWGWWYEREFTLDPALAAGEVTLVLEGLDCLGAVWLNGVHLGDTANALIEHRLRTAGALRPGVNRLAIRVSSGMREVRAGDLGPVGATHQGSGVESLRLRKAPHQFGWDIMPRLVSAGLWRPLRLEAAPVEAVRSVYWTTLDVDAVRRTATVLVDWTLGLPDVGWEHWRVRISIAGLYQGECGISAARGRRMLRLSNVDLWWPRGWGAATLYQASVELVDPHGVVAHAHTTSIGIRSVKLRRSEALDANGRGDFGFEVNGTRLYAKGTNWVPLDALHSRDGQHLAAALAMLEELGCNMVRMWGGNVYESDEFYAWCDAHGMLIWQDFALACGTYPQDDAFAAALGAEADAVVRRLRNHPSMAVWCGSNETDQAPEWRWPGLRVDPNRDRATREVLARAVADHDPVRDYLPSSPYLSPAVQAGGGQPEDHLWGPRDDFKGTYYRRSAACFVSEIGYHGCPSAASLARMVPPGTALWPLVGNRALLPLSVKPLPHDEDYDYRIPLMARQAAQLIGREPRDLAEFVNVSQLSQAEAMKSFIETWRARKGRTWGMLWWNLRDGWPIISDAVVDWFGERKLAFAAIKASQQEVVALVEEPEGWQHRVVLVNDRRTAVRLTVVIDELGGAECWRGTVEIPANGTSEACRLPQVQDGARCWRLRWSGDASGANHYLAGPRPWPAEQLLTWYRELGLAPLAAPAGKSQ
jgi:beta-mannosidase